jgi:hypothetical protein
VEYRLAEPATRAWIKACTYSQQMTRPQADQHRLDSAAQTA